MHVASKRAALLCLVGSLLLVGCGPNGVAVKYPTSDEALAITTKAVQLAQQGQFEALCALGGGNCEVILETAGRQEVPPLPPALHVGRRIATTTQNGGLRTGGQVVVACGIAKDGSRYKTEMLVFFDDDSLRVIEPVFWSRLTVAEGNSTNASPTTEGC